VVVPYPASGTTDIMARLVANYPSEKLGQTFVIENKPGGGTDIGTQEVINATPDGYTLLIPSRRTLSTPRSTRSFHSISSATPCRLRALRACRT
jgi:tripartite-type tricarboxylate transporter receptor subunit TctC